MNHLELGRLGEDLAARHLKKAGYKIMERNVAFPGLGEIDLVAQDKDTLVLVEVKTRSGDHHRPAEAVGPAKRRRLLKAATLYLKKRPGARARFDVVELIIKDQAPPVINHIIDAFDGGT